MKKSVGRSKLKLVLVTIGIMLFTLFVFLPLLVSIFVGSHPGNVALIPLQGAITSDGDQSLGVTTISSKAIVNFIEDANANDQVKVLLLEINSPGGSAVASDEIAAAVKKSKKPVVALIREAGASGAYWIASASDHIIANRMSITGSIGVVSSYLEFSGLMEEYGVGYERLVAGEKKDLGTPYKKLSDSERLILEKKLQKIHQFFVKEVAANRNLELSYLQNVATGEFYLGEEALEMGLVDQLGGKDQAEAFIQEQYGLKEINYHAYEYKVGFFDLLGRVSSTFFFNIGEGIGSVFVKQPLGVLV